MSRELLEEAMERTLEEGILSKLKGKLTKKKPTQTHPEPPSDDEVRESVRRANQFNWETDHRGYPPIKPSPEIRRIVDVHNSMAKPEHQIDLDGKYGSHTLSSMDKSEAAAALAKLRHGKIDRSEFLHI